MSTGRTVTSHSHANIPKPTATTSTKPLAWLRCLANQLEQDYGLPDAAIVIRSCVASLELDDSDRELLLWAADVAERRADALRVNHPGTSAKYREQAKRLKEMAGR